MFSLSFTPLLLSHRRYKRNPNRLLLAKLIAPCKTYYIEQTYQKEKRVRILMSWWLRGCSTKPDLFPRLIRLRLNTSITRSVFVLAFFMVSWINDIMILNFPVMLCFGRRDEFYFYFMILEQGGTFFFDLKNGGSGFDGIREVGIFLEGIGPSC